MTDSPRDVLERLVEPFDDEPHDWADVLERAQARRAVRKRFPRALVLAVALLALGLAVAVPFGLAERVIGLFKEGGKPVPVASLNPADRDALILSMCSQVKLVTPAGKAPEKRCPDSDPEITEIANNGRRLYWKVVFPNGTECLASGSVRGYRENGGGRSHVGMIGCARSNQLQFVPSPERPITVEAPMTFRVGESRAHLIRASGLAGDGVASVGLVEKDGDVLRTSVEGRTYDFGQPPDREWDSIAAYDDSGTEVFRESLHLDVPVQDFTGRPRKPTRPKPLPPLPNKPPAQHGAAPGATLDVYRGGLVAVHLAKDGRPYRLLRPRQIDQRVGVTCQEVAYGAGRWETLGSGSYGIFGPDIRAFVSSRSSVQRGGQIPRPPFDLCSVRGSYGLRWNDVRGMHDAVEVPFTPLGRRYFDELAVAQDLALFMRTPQMRTVRRGMKHGRVPTAAHIAALFPTRVVGLAARTDSTDPENIAIWTNRKNLIMISRRAQDGRRLYVTLRDSGVFGPNNLAGLKQIHY